MVVFPRVMIAVLKRKWTSVAVTRTTMMAVTRTRRTERDEVIRNFHGLSGNFPSSFISVPLIEILQNPNVQSFIRWAMIWN